MKNKILQSFYLASWVAVLTIAIHFVWGNQIPTTCFNLPIWESAVITIPIVVTIKFLIVTLNQVKNYLEKKDKLSKKDFASMTIFGMVAGIIFAIAGVLHSIAILKYMFLAAVLMCLVISVNKKNVFHGVTCIIAMFLSATLVFLIAKELAFMAITFLTVFVLKATHKYLSES